MSTVLQQANQAAFAARMKNTEEKQGSFGPFSNQQIALNDARFSMANLVEGEILPTEPLDLATTFKQTKQQMDVSKINDILRRREGQTIVTNYVQPQNNPLYSYSPLGTFMQNSIKQQITTTELESVATNSITVMIVISLIAFALSWYSNKNCKTLHRVGKSVVAALFGGLYIIIFLIKYSLTNC
jgi:hypothetical protein